MADREASEESEPRTRTVTASLSYVLVLFGLTLVMAALLQAVVFGQPFDAVLDQADTMSSTNASATGITWVRQMGEWFPLWAGTLGMILLMSGAVTESRRTP